MSKSHLNPAVDHRAKVNPAGSAAPASAANGNSNVKEVKPNRDQIQRRAYELYCQRVARGEKGTPESDWMQAERELVKKS